MTLLRYLSYLFFFGGGGSFSEVKPTTNLFRTKRFHRGAIPLHKNYQLGIHLSDAKIIDSSCIERSVTEIIEIFLAETTFIPTLRLR